MSAPLVLGIESSCDETGVGIVRGHELLANEVASSVEEHVRFGGVVPEVASRAHLQAIVPALQRAQEQAGIDLSEEGFHIVDGDEADEEADDRRPAEERRVAEGDDDGEHPREPRKQPVGCRQQRCNKNHGESVVGQYYRNRSGDQTQ